MTTAPPIATRQLGAALAIGSFGLVTFGLQPVVLGALAAEGRVPDAALGALVTAELLAIAAGSLAGARLLHRLSATHMTMIGGALTLAANTAMLARAALPLLLALRAGAGIGEGLLVAIAVAAIARADRPARSVGYFLVIQTLLQLGAAAATSAFPHATSPADAGFLMLAAGGALAILTAPFAPTDLRPYAGTDAHGSLPSRSLPALVATGCSQGGILVVWSYLGLWMTSRHHSADIVDGAVAACIALQIAGAFLAGWASDRLPSRATLLAASIAQALGVATAVQLDVSDPGAILFGVFFGFSWQFVAPFFTALLVDVDPGRRAVLLMPAAQLVGAATMPLAAAPVVARWGSDGAMIFGAVIFATTALVLGAMRAHQPDASMRPLPTLLRD